MKNETDSEEYEDYFGFINEVKPKEREEPSFDELEEYSNRTVEEETNSLGEPSTTIQIENPSDCFSIVESYCDSSSTFEEVQFKGNPAILWNRREYVYSLDQSSRDQIWRVFERRLKSTLRPTVVDKDINEDAFYAPYTVTPSYDISILREDKYINSVLSCENIRIINFHLLDFYATNTKDIEKYIQLYKTCNDSETKIVLEGVILQMKRIGVLIDKVRNYISSISLRGEEAFKFLENVYYIVFKKNGKLGRLALESLYNSVN